MYGELMRIETLVERIAELKEANRRLLSLNAAYKDMFARMRNLVEAVGV